MACRASNERSGPKTTSGGEEAQAGGGARRGRPKTEARASVNKGGRGRKANEGSGVGDASTAKSGKEGGTRAARSMWGNTEGKVSTALRHCVPKPCAERPRIRGYRFPTLSGSALLFLRAHGRGGCCRWISTGLSGLPRSKWIWRPRAVCFQPHTSPRGRWESHLQPRLGPHWQETGCAGAK